MSRHTGQVCAASADLPLQLLLFALEIAPDEPGHPLEVVTQLRCPLEGGHLGPHLDLVRALDGDRGDVWARWEDGQEPRAVAVLADCTADNGLPGGAQDACTLFLGHPGGHGFTFVDAGFDTVPEADRAGSAS
ncbi:hypothetical protein ACFQ61_18435 [Streptomyces sp. NPDC056500]|uniref:hypothetical protein n=1 Tax=Streptomyces sp. NPDC056500 TaxID=3345840 RepID=UPI0036CFF879